MPRPPQSPSPPPSTSFNFTTGSFDFPRPSLSPPPIRDRLANLLRIQARDEQDHIHPEPPSRRRQHRAAHMNERASDWDAWRLLSSNSNPRPRATPSERHLRRSRTRLRDQRSANVDTAAEIIGSLGDLPLSNLFAQSTPNTRSRSPTTEAEGQRRQAKRRKLEHDDRSPSPYDGFKYGHKGQVVSGRLRMDIVSCDGGEYRQSRPPEVDYKVQNVLRNDPSVYCSETSKCNLLLKHLPQAPFALEKIVIRAPDRGFTAPVQEGLVFVSMSPEGLLTGTAAYQLQYGNRSPPASPTPDPFGDEQLTLQEAIGDPFIWQQSRRNVQNDDDDGDMEERIERLRLRSRRLQSGRARRREERRHQEADEDAANDNCEYTADDAYPRGPGVSAPTPPPFTITTPSEEESEPEEQPSPAVMADRMRRESRHRSDSEGDDDDFIAASLIGPPRRALPLESYDSYGERRWRSNIETIRATRLHTPSRIEPVKSAPETESVIAPHASFFIPRNKNKITIKFHPAVSGKYILLKLWSPTHDGNIDIESVQFYGYSGPRYFPAMQPR